MLNIFDARFLDENLVFEPTTEVAAKSKIQRIMSGLFGQVDRFFKPLNLLESIG